MSSDGWSRMPTLDKLQRGDILEGRYLIDRQIGRGGMSTVYAANDLRFIETTRWCAVKEISDRLLTQGGDWEKATEAFRREASIVASLSHPAIPKVYDFFPVGQKLYLVMEYIEGEDLERAIASKSVLPSAHQVADWAMQICDVLTYLHDHKPDPIIFRDLKPSNVMLVGGLAGAGRIMLIDFGIARHLAPKMKGTMVGTEGYSPPEQYQGIADPRADLYALGALMHHLLSGVDPREEAPFTFPNRPLTKYNATVTPALNDAIQRSLAYEPGDRWDSAEHFKQALEGSLGHSRSRVRRTSTVVMPTESGIGEVKLLWRFDTADEIRSSPEIDEDRECVYIGSYDGNLYCLDLLSGQQIWKRRTRGGISGSPLLTGERVIVGSEDGTIYALDAEKGDIVWRHPTGGPVRATPRYREEEKIVYVGSDDGHLYMLDEVSGKLLWRLRFGTPIRSAALAVESMLYVAGYNHYVGAADWYPSENQDEAPLMHWAKTLQGEIVSSPVYDPLNRSLIVSALDGQLHSLNALTGFKMWTLRLGPALIATPALHAGTLYVGSVDGTIYAVEGRMGKILWRVSTQDQIASSVRIVDERLYLGSADSMLYCLSLTGDILWRFQTEGKIISRPAVTHGITIVGALDGSVYAVEHYPDEEAPTEEADPDDDGFDDL